MTLDEWSDLIVATRSWMNSRLLSVPVYLLGAVVFPVLCEGSLTRTTALVTLHIGLFVSVTSSAFGFALAAQNPTRVSRAFFTLWFGFAVIAFFEFGWKQGAAAVILYIVYAQVGRWLSGLIIGGLFLRLVVRDQPGPGGSG